MIALPYWINERLAIVPRPRGNDWLDDEMLALREAGIDVVLSMLESAEATELGLEREAAAAELAGITFLNFPIQDRGIPTHTLTFKEFLSKVESYLEDGNRIGIHCRACIGRASIASASLLIRAGATSEDAWKQVANARGCSVPDTKEQRAWVDQNMKLKQL